MSHRQPKEDRFDALKFIGSLLLFTLSIGVLWWVLLNWLT